MKTLKLTIATFVLGIIACSPNANATDLSATTKLRSESGLELAQANLKDAEKYFNSGISALNKVDIRRQ